MLNELRKLAEVLRCHLHNNPPFRPIHGSHARGGTQWTATPKGVGGGVLSHTQPNAYRKRAAPEQKAPSSKLEG